MDNDHATYFGATRRYILCLIALFCVTTIDASAQTTLINEQEAPLVLLWIDTSGSMEYLSQEGLVPDCQTPNPAKSRWAQTLEILTGTFNGHSCELDPRLVPPSREDFAYPVPHVKYTLTGTPPQFSDGLLDILDTQIKFGFSTFDADPASMTNQQGSWSYGTTTSTGTNLGARNQNAPIGGMVLPAATDLESMFIQKANDIEQSLWSTIPYGGTPLSPFMDDAQYLFKNEPSVGSYNGQSGIGDKFHSCREKFVILITDGKPTMGEATDGYSSSAQAAASLYAEGVTVFVIGFNVQGQDINVLDEIAYAGSGGSIQTAFIADSQQQLSVVMSAILLEILGNPVTRTLTVFTTETGNNLDSMYQFNTGYSPDATNALNRVGIIEQSIYRCDAACKESGSAQSAGICEIDDLAQYLDNSVTTRNLLTSIENRSGLQDFATSNGDITEDLLQITTQGDLPNLALSTLPNGLKICGKDSLGPASDENIRRTFKDQVIALIRADEGSCRAAHKLGAIFHSTPAIQSNLEAINLNDPSFRLYRENVSNRPTMLYTSTHEGIFHGFRVDRPVSMTDNELGQELFGYIPNFVLGKLNRLSGRFDFILDGPPKVREILLFRDSASTSAEVLADRWRSVVVVPGGFRTSGVFAMDVTDPFDPKVLWEISPSGRCAPESTGLFRCNDTTQSVNDYSLMGFVRGQVAIGSAFFEFDGVAQERGIVLVGGGTQREGVDQSGKVVFVVDLATGKRVAAFHNSSNNIIDNSTAVGGASGLDFDMVGHPACYNTFPGTLITRCIMGDAGGQLWYLRLGLDPANWQLHFFHDAYNIDSGEQALTLDSTARRPVWEAPALSLHPDRGRLVVNYHTSRVEDVRDSPPNPPRLVSVLENISLDATGTAQNIGAQTNWVKYFNEGMPTGSPLVFASTVYQTLYVPVEADFCATGNGYLWGLNYLGNDPDSIEDVIPAIDADGDPTTSEVVTNISLGQGLPAGVELLLRPTCDGNSPINASSNLDGDQAPAELVIQRTGGTNSPDQLPSSGALPKITRITQTLPSTPQRVFLNAWGNLLE